MAKRRESTKPYLDHETLSQAEQAKFLGSKPETLLNLGHLCSVADIAKHPLGKPINYDTAPQAERQIKEGQRLTQGVYGRHAPIKSGISSADNLQAWSNYARSNSYHGGHGEGVEPTMPDRRNSVPDGSPGKDSDGHLQSTRNWASYEYGGDSGLGRLEKSEKY